MHGVASDTQQPAYKIHPLLDSKQHINTKQQMLNT